MTNAERRLEKKTMPETNRTRGQGKRRIIEADLRKKIKKLKNRKEYVNALYNAAVKDRQGWAFTEINNRVDGKVKDVQDINIHLIEHIPDQAEEKKIEESFKQVDWKPVEAEYEMPE